MADNGKISHKRAGLSAAVDKPPGKIFAIFHKPIWQNIYTELTFQSGSIDITKKCLPLNLLEKVDKSLFIQESPS
ncbi:MAG: hypothetical protein HDQ97_09395 [Lachnospiraceae bacterium]|nr:hypothetical protein [Lachnospiraceae bacterium]